MNNVLSYITCFGWLPLFLMGLLGLILGWLLWGLFGRKGDSGEADGLRARIRELEARPAAAAPAATLSADRDKDVIALRSRVRELEGQLDADPAPAGDDDTYALEWRNRYLAARVKYLEGRVSDAPKAKAAPKKRAAPKKKAAPKKAAPKKAPKPKVLYKDGPTAGKPDDLKLIKGIGPKFEKDLNGKGIYYFRQIAAWKKKDVDMVEGIIDSIPGRIGRDEWVPQARGLSKKAKPAAASSRKKPGPKPGSKRGATNQDGTPRKKPGPKSSGKKASAGNDKDKYYANVKKYHKGADRQTVDNIVKYCGIALRSRDASLVACSDATELNTVSKNFAVKKLGLTKEQGDQLAKDVCQEMKGQRFKGRVTFYYLMAKRANKLSIFS